jgi:hypothetical protein
MKFRSSTLLGFVVSLVTAGGAAAADASDQPGYSNKWRVEVSESAKSDGTMLFRVTPKEGTPVEVTVSIKDGRGENNIAKDIRDAFKAALDAKSFHTETDDGEDVLLKKRKGPDFALVLVESNVEAVRLNIEKE